MSDERRSIEAALERLFGAADDVWLGPFVPLPELGEVTTRPVASEDLIFVLLDAAYRHSRRIEQDPDTRDWRFLADAGATLRAKHDATFLAELGDVAGRHYLKMPLQKDGNYVIRREDLWSATVAAQFADSLRVERSEEEHLRALERITLGASPLLRWSEESAKRVMRRYCAKPGPIFRIRAASEPARALVGRLGGPGDKKIKIAAAFINKRLDSAKSADEERDADNTKCVAKWWSRSPRDVEALLESIGGLPDGEVVKRQELLLYLLDDVLKLDSYKAYRVMRWALDGEDIPG